MAGHTKSMSGQKKDINNWRIMQNLNDEVSERVRYSRKTITPSGYFGDSEKNIVEIETEINQFDKQIQNEFIESINKKVNFFGIVYFLILNSIN